MKRILKILAGFTIGLFTLPLAAALWPFACAYIVATEIEEE